jgi:predicted DNA-binding antitoxin AbrB/MazE fold protein
MMAEKLHGVIYNGAIKLNEPIDLPNGTKVEIMVIGESYREAWKRQSDLMKRGFPMGRRRKVQREELHERG